MFNGEFSLAKKLYSFECKYTLLLFDYLSFIQSMFDSIFPFFSTKSIEIYEFCI